MVRALEPFKKVANLHPKRLRDGVQPTGGDPIPAFFVLVRLLIGDPDQVRDLQLGQTQHDPEFTYPAADVAVDILCPGSAYHLLSPHGA